MDGLKGNVVFHHILIHFSSFFLSPVRAWANSAPLVFQAICLSCQISMLYRHFMLTVCISLAISTHTRTLVFFYMFRSKCSELFFILTGWILTKLRCAQMFFRSAFFVQSGGCIVTCGYMEHQYWVCYVYHITQGLAPPFSVQDLAKVI